MAKLNVAPGEAHETLREFGALLEPILSNRFQPAREQLDLATRLTLNQAYYQVREAETQALFGIYRAEVEARNLDDFLRRLVRVLTAALRARSGRIVGMEQSQEPWLGKPRYIERGGRPRISDRRCQNAWPLFLLLVISARRAVWLPNSASR